MSEENKSEKVGFFKRILISIKDFDRYQEFAMEDLKKAMKYFLKIILIFSAVISIVFTTKFMISLQNGISYFKENIRQIEYKDSNLSVNSNEEIILEGNDAFEFVVVNTQVSKEEASKYTDRLNDYDSGIIILKDRIILKNKILPTNTEYMYGDISKNYGITEFNKDTITEFISSLNMVTLYASFVFTMLIYMFIVYFVSTFMDVIMVAVLGFIIARIAGIKIRFKATFNMGVYALTLPIILNLIYIIVNTLTGFTIKYFGWMYTTISYIYMIVAILMIKTDLISKQKELAKIHEEQLKVREELQKREEDKKEEEKEQLKDENETPEEKNRKNKKEKPNEEDGLAPQE